MTLGKLKILVFLIILTMVGTQSLAQSRIIHRFVNDMADTCDTDRMLQYKDKKIRPLRAIIERNVEYIDTNGTDVHLYKFSCMGEGADELFALYLHIVEVDIFYLLHFAEPTYNVEETAVLDGSSLSDMSLMKMTGIRTNTLLYNPDFIATKDEIVSYIKLTDDGGSYIYGKWKWDPSQFEFILKHYEVDESSDGQKNPTIKIEFK